ncbi:MAG: lysophospholipid acyltransferase family protein, partial [Candidatus Omnitrophota bacterium]
LLTYALFRFFTFPLQFLPYKILHRLGNALGLLVYYCYPKYRKRALSNLALATDLHLTPSQIVHTAKRSLQNLAITALEYPRLSIEKNIHRLATCENPETASEIIQSGQGVIFFCGHQTNWEILFLEGTKRMPGVAIGRPIKNDYLYRWIIALRQKFGGTIIRPTNAYKEAFRALKQGKFVGIVGDQGMPDSGFCSSFLGRKAWTSPLPALLSSRTGCPIIVATTRRELGKYFIHYSDPILPTENPHEQMQQVLAVFEATIKERPHEWLWIHNRWKQQLPGRLAKRFRHDAIAFIFPDDPDALSSLSEIRQLYPREQLTAFIPSPLTSDANVEVISYHKLEDLLVRDYRFKLVVDFTGNKKLQRHFFNLSALKVASFTHPKEFLAHARR